MLTHRVQLNSLQTRMHTNLFFVLSSSPSIPFILFTEDRDCEESCYDDDHRDFFRLLRQQHIDIVAAYENMNCTESFLSRLLQRHVLTHPEWRELVEAAHSLPRSSVNRKLIDMINLKASQVQTTFSDLLHRFQPHLLREDELGSDVEGQLELIRCSKQC